MSELAHASIEVEVSSLADLGRLMLGEAERMRVDAAQVLFPLNDAAPNFAGNGLVEGATLEPVHEEARQHLNRFLTDLVDGLTTLGNAALAVAAEYGESDAYGAASVEAVRGAFPSAD